MVQQVLLDFKLEICHYVPSRIVQIPMQCVVCRVVISHMKSSWRPITGGVPPGLILEPVLFNIFSYDLDDRTACTLNKFADNAKLGGVVDTPDDCAAVQRDLETLEKWADRDLIKFNTG